MISWKIYNRRFDGTDLMVDIEINPYNAPLRYSLYQVWHNNYPEFVSDVANSTSTGYEFVHFRFFNDIDWEDQLWVKNFRGHELKKGEVFIVNDVVEEQAIIEEQIFNKIVFDFASELLKVYANDKKLPFNWSNEMKDALEKLKNKILGKEKLNFRI
jgi:hypothetical protein